MTSTSVSSSSAEQAALVLRKPKPLLIQSGRRLVRDWGGRFGLILVLFLTVAGLLAPVVAPFDPLEIGVGMPLEEPTSANVLGTDELGRDVLSRLLYGAGISIRVSFLAAIAALIMATPLGLLAGFMGGGVDGAICRVFDTIFAFPGILVGIALAGIFGGGMTSVILAVGIINIPSLGRLTRVGVLAQRAEDYVLAATALGATSGRIMLRHVLPNVFPGLIVQIALIMARAVLLEAEFSFLGLGSKPPTPSWGIMLNEGRAFLSTSPWQGIFAGVAITMLILGFNSLGDALQRVLNPRLVNR